MFSTVPFLRRVGIATALSCAAVLQFSGCTTTTASKSSTSTTSETRQSLNSAADATLSRLYQASPQSKELVARARGVLVFPDVLSGSFIVGAEHGNGVLRVGGTEAGYYSTTAGSIGFQAGAQSKAMVLLFMTDESLSKFRKSSGWTVGADATVAVVNVGAHGAEANRWLCDEQRRPHGGCVTGGHKDIEAGSVICSSCEERCG